MPVRRSAWPSSCSLSAAGTRCETSAGSTTVPGDRPEGDRSPARGCDFALSSVAVRPSCRSGLALAAEIGTALFEEGPRSLLRFLALVVQRQRLEAERADAADVFAVGVERALGDRDRGRRQRQDLAAPRLDLGVELPGRDDLVDETHLVRLGGRIAPAQEPDLARP